MAHPDDHFAWSMRNIYTTRRSRRILRPLPAHIHRKFAPIRILDKTVPPLLGDHMDDSVLVRGDFDDEGWIISSEIFDSATNM
jgi:hypothetical protein